MSIYIHNFCLKIFNSTVLFSERRFLFVVFQVSVAQVTLLIQMHTVCYLFYRKHTFYVH